MSNNAGTLKTATSFQFYTRLSLCELTGLKAGNLRELLSCLKIVPEAVIYHHTHHFLEEHQYLSPEPPNDFSYWVTAALGEALLGERLAGINTCEFSTIQSLRDRIISVIEEFLKETQSPLRQVSGGQALYFVKSVSFVFPTPYAVNTLEEFLGALKKISIHSIFFHMFDAKLRLGRGSNDFSRWIESSLGDKELAQKIAKMDPYAYTLEGLRNKIIQWIEQRRLAGVKPGEDV